MLPEADGAADMQRWSGSGYMRPNKYGLPGVEALGVVPDKPEGPVVTIGCLCISD